MERKFSLKQGGKLWDKNATVSKDGLVAALSNHPIKEHLWKINRTCAHHSSGDVASSDERGQVYVYSVAQNTYHGVRMASTPVSAMEFIHCRKSRLIVAYAHGTIAIVDTDDKSVVGHLQLAKPTVITRICCHPTKPRAMLVAEDGTVSIWDLRTLLCTQTLASQEPLIGLEYDLGGSFMALVYETIGVVYYHTEDGKPELKCCLPENERQPRWVSYCSSLGRDRILLAGDNGMVYIFDGQRGITITSTQFADRVMYENDSRYVKGVCPVLSIAELPVQYGNVICMRTLETSSNASAGISSTSSEHGLTVAMLTDKAHILLINISEERTARKGNRFEARSLCSEWTWRIISDVSMKPCTPEASNQRFTGSTLTPALSVKRTGTMYSTLRQSGDLAAHGKASTALTGHDRMVVIRNASYRKGAGPELVNHLAALPDKEDHIFDEYFMSFAVDDSGSILVYDWGEILAEDSACRASGDVKGMLLRHRSCGQSSLGIKDQQKTSSHLGPASDAGRKKPPTDRSKIKARVNSASDENRASNSFNQSIGHKEDRPGSVKVTSTGTSSSATVRRRSELVHSEVAVLDSSRNTSDSVALPSMSSSIYDLSGMRAAADKGSKMSKAKLIYFLDKNDRYPDEYRSLIWRFLLQLPENEVAFADLVKRNTHASYGSKLLGRKYPLESSRLFSKLQAICSQLAHWSSVFGEAPYLPQLCFPFILIYDNDELAALETVMSLLMWWGYSWHTCHPNPPPHLTDSFDALLLHYDPSLHKHFRSLEVSPGLIGWRLTYTMYSEFLSKESWLRVMDFIFTHFESMELMLLVPVAIIRMSSASLLCSYSADHIMKFFAAQQEMKASSLVNMVKHMMVMTPKSMLLACYRGVKSRAHDMFKSEKAEIEDLKAPKRVVYKANTGHRGTQSGLPGSKGRNASRKFDLTNPSGIDLDDEIAAWRATPAEAVRQSLAAEVGTPLFPLPRGRYPAYDGFPKAMIDWELRKRSVQMALDEEIECREDVLHELEKRIEELDGDHEIWMANHKAATENEIKSRYELMNREKEHMRQLAVMEDLISRKRLSALTSLEKTSKEELSMLDEAAAQTKQMLDAGEEHLRSKMDASISIQRHRELGETAEAIINDRMHKLYVDRARDERMKSLSETLQQAESEMTARAAQMSSELNHLEDIAKAKRAQRLAQSKDEAEQETAARMRNSMLVRLSKLAIEREDKLLALEREAALKAIKEEAREAEEALLRSQILYEKQEENLSKEMAAKLAVEALQASKLKLAQVMDEIKQQSEVLLEQERVAALKEGQSRLKSRGSNIIISQISSLQAQMEDALHAQIEAQNELVRLKSLSLNSERYIQSIAHSSGVLKAKEKSSQRSMQDEKYSEHHSEFNKRRELRAANIDHQAKADSSDTSSGSRDRPTETFKKRTFAAVNALLGIDEADITERPKTRGKRVDRRAHLDYDNHEDNDDNNSSGHNFESEKPLPSRSILSPQESGLMLNSKASRRTFDEDSEEKLVTSSHFVMRQSANEDWSDGIDIQFPAAGRLKEKIYSESSGAEVSSRDEQDRTETKSTTTTRRGVRWGQQQNTHDDDESGGSGLGYVEDIKETKWAGFSYSDRTGYSSSDDGEQAAMKKLAEKNLDLLVRLRADDRQGGDTVERDVHDLLQATENGSESSRDDFTGGAADGDDDDSALWNFEKYSS